MNHLNLKYQIQVASEEDIYLHLKKCNQDFIPPLDNKINLKKYSKKIVENAVTFEAWNHTELVGLVATYMNDLEKKIGYVTNVSVTKDWSSRGVAAELINRCIEYAKNHFYHELDLEVSAQNIRALQLYRKIKFIDFEKKKDMIIMKLKINNNNR